MTDLESELLMQMNERIVKNFIDILILVELKHGPLSYGELTSIFHKKFGETIHFSLIDLNLNFLEKEEMIASRNVRSRKVYELTRKGEEKIQAFLNSKNKILGLFLNLFI